MELKKAQPREHRYTSYKVSKDNIIIEIPPLKITSILTLIHRSTFPNLESHRDKICRITEFINNKNEYHRPTTKLFIHVR